MVENKQLRLLPLEQVYDKVNGVWNLSSDQVRHRCTMRSGIAFHGSVKIKRDFVSVADAFDAVILLKRCRLLLWGVTEE